MLQARVNFELVPVPFKHKFNNNLIILHVAVKKNK